MSAHGSRCAGVPSEARRARRWGFAFAGSARARRWALAAWIGMALLARREAHAQGPPAPPAVAPAPPAAEPPPPALSPEEMAEIQRAVGADQRALAEQQPAAPAPQAAPGGGGVLQALLPDISVVLDVALAVFSSDEPLQTGGHDPQETGFTFQQLEVSISKAVDPYFRFDSFIVFSQFGVEVEEAYATTLALPWSLQARAGQFLTRFGRINATHPHAWDFVDQPIAIGRIFGGEGNRGVGVELSWLTPLPWYVEVLGSVTDAAGEGTARSFFGAEDSAVEGPLDFQLTAAIKQFFPLSDDWSLLWGLSAANGPNATGHDNRTDVYGTDLYLKYRPITHGSHTVVALQTEWLYRRRQAPGVVEQDVSGYAQLLWKLAQRWGTAVRYEYGSPTYDLAGDRIAGGLDPEWTSHRHRAGASVTFWPTEFSRLRLQGSSDMPGWRERPIWAAFLAAEFTVGAHGAHAF
jgi:hypothetical protein